MTWDDRASAVVTGLDTVSARLHEAGTAPDSVHVPLAFRKVSSEPQKSRYRISLPGPNLPIVAIEAVVANGEVFRAASVYAQRLEGGVIMPVLLGQGLSFFQNLDAAHIALEKIRIVETGPRTDILYHVKKKKEQQTK